MKKLILIPLLIVLAGALIFGGCAAPAPAPAPAGWPEVITFGAGPVGGGHNMVAMGIAPVWEKETGIAFPLSPGTPKHNLHRFEAQRLDIMVQSSFWSLLAWQGIEDFGFQVPIRDLRALCYDYPNPFYIIALKDSGLTKVTDLKGKNVGCGPSPAIWGKRLGDLFEAHGIKYFGDNPDFRQNYASYQDLCEMLGDGLLDATMAMFEGLVPQPATMKLMEEKELVALEWDPKIRKQFEGTLNQPAVIKAELAPFLDKDHLCFLGGTSCIEARDTMDEELIYTLTKIIHENLDKIAAENPYWKYPTLYPDILTKNHGIPFHPGAVRYWKEVGLWQ